MVLKSLLGLTVRTTWTRLCSVNSHQLLGPLGSAQEHTLRNSAYICRNFSLSLIGSLYLLPSPAWLPLVRHVSLPAWPVTFSQHGGFLACFSPNSQNVQTYLSGDTDIWTIQPHLRDQTLRGCNSPVFFFEQDFPLWNFLAFKTLN